MRTHLVLRVCFAFPFLFLTFCLLSLGQETPIALQLLDVYFLFAQVVLELGLGGLCREKLALEGGMGHVRGECLGTLLALCGRVLWVCEDVVWLARAARGRREERAYRALVQP